MVYPHGMLRTWPLPGGGLASRGTSIVPTRPLSKSSANIDFFKSRGLDKIPTRGAFSVTVPGVVDGWATLLEKYGTMSLEQVLEPAIEYAENEFTASEETPLWLLY